MLLRKTQQEIADVFKLTQPAIVAILNLDENISNIKNDITNKDKRTKLSSDEEVSVAEFYKKHESIDSLSGGAILPLMREQDVEIREAAIKKISEDIIGKQHAGRGHKKKLTAKGVKEVIEIERIAITPPYYYYFDISHLSLKLKIKKPIQHSRIIT